MAELGHYPALFQVQRPEESRMPSYSLRSQKPTRQEGGSPGGRQALGAPIRQPTSLYSHRGGLFGPSLCLSLQVTTPCCAGSFASGKCLAVQSTYYGHKAVRGGKYLKMNQTWLLLSKDVTMGTLRTATCDSQLFHILDSSWNLWSF